MDTIKLDKLQEIPMEVVSLSDGQQIRLVFPNPTLISLEGERRQPLFLSLLLHGNEQTSFRVLQRLANYIESHPLPRSLIIFVGNVFASEANQRFLKGQQDFNRIWSGGLGPEVILAKEVLSCAQEQGPLLASIDIHNNTGANPFYGCVNELENKNLYLASLFSKTVVYFRTPNSAQSIAFSKLCPSVTIECGQSEVPEGIDAATQFVLDVLNLESLDHPLKKGDVNVFQTIGQLRVSPDVNLRFEDEEAQEQNSLTLPADFEFWNFAEVPAGTKVGQVSDLESLPFSLVDDNGEDRINEFFELASSGEILTKKVIIPSMFTKDKKVIAQDCLGYLMKSL